MKILWTGICWLHMVSARHLGGCLFQYSQTTCHNKQILGIAHNSHGGEAGTCQACSHAELPRCCFPCPQQATPQLGSIPRRRSVIGKTGSLMALLNKLRKWDGINRASTGLKNRFNLPNPDWEVTWDAAQPRILYWTNGRLKVPSMLWNKKLSLRIALEVIIKRH